MSSKQARKAKRKRVAKKILKGIDKGLKKTKIISTLAKAGVPLAGQYAPLLAVAGTTADKLGYGRRKMIRRRKPRKGGCCGKMQGGCKFN